jgi:hypothetical protein
MLKSESLALTWKLRRQRIGSRSLWVLIALLVFLPASSAFGQFTLQMDPFPYPAAINPGGESAANITLTPTGTFTGTVDLTCQVTFAATGQVVTSPACEVSPQSVVLPGGATATVTSPGSPPAGLYIVKVTGTADGFSASAQQNLTVLAVSPDFTITVTEAVAPSSVHAGSGGTGTISVNPINGYIIPSGGVTLSCATITPLVTAPPVCSFNPNPVPPGTTSSTLTITTTGPTTPAAVARTRRWYALWLPLPMLMLASMGMVSGKRSRRAWGLLAVFVLAGGILLMPACGNTASTTTTTPSNLVTPNNAYTFTLMGVDSNGVTSSNTGTTSSAPTVTLTVD